MATGDVEVVADDLEIISEAKTPPFEIEDDVKADEALRLKYRYLDIRRPKMTHNLELRHRDDEDRPQAVFWSPPASPAAHRARSRH